MKTLRYAVMSLLTAALSLGVTSCSSDGVQDFDLGPGIAVNAASVAGTWKYVYYNTSTVEDNSVVMELNSDNSVVTTYYDQEGAIITNVDGTKKQVSGTWSLQGNTIRFVGADGQEAGSYIIQNLKADAMYVVLAKDAVTGLSNQMMQFTRVN